MPTDEIPGQQPHPASPAVFGGAPLPYMRWAKTWLGPDPLSLGLSGLAPLADDARRELGLAAAPEFGAAAALKSALARRYGLEPENVHPAAGTSHANFIAHLALARGGHVVVETPAYEALPRLGAVLGSSVAFVRRDPERDWRIDPASLEHALRPATALIVVSDLHNPSGMRLRAEDLDLLIAASESSGAHVLVDEVYADFDPLERPTAAHRSPRVIVTNSLTKSHGLPDLRAGWVLGAADRIRTIDAWDDLVHPVLPPLPLAEAARYVPQARALLARTRARAAERGALVDAWVGATAGVRWTRPDAGITGFLLFDEGVDGDDVAARLWDQHAVRAVPGSFFGLRAGLRVSFDVEEANLQRALAGIAAVLEGSR